MSFNKNNPNTMGKLRGYLMKLSTEMGGSEQSRRSQDEERLYRGTGPKYARVPSRATLSASTTCTSLATSCGSQGTLAPNYAAIPETISTESSSEDEDAFEKTRRHFQQLRQVSLGTERKYKMELETKEENLRNSVPFVKQLSLDSNKVDYAINGDTQYRAAKPQIQIKTQVFAALAVSLGSLIVGFTSGYTSPVQLQMRKDLEISKEENSWIGGLVPLLAMVGGVLGGPLIECIGRKKTTMLTSLPFFIGWILIANANVTLMVMAGRAMCGLSVGIASLSFPVYVGETAQPEVRGALGMLPTAFGNIGILVAYIAGAFLNWSNLAFVGAILPVPFFLMMLYAPETPRWYITKKRTEEARKALQWLRGKHVNVDKEMRDLTRSQAESDRTGGNPYRQLFSRKYIPIVLILLILMFVQQLSGINAFIFYSNTIFKESGSSINENVSSIILGMVNFISTFIATVLVDRLGRKMLLYVSSVSMITTLVTLGSFLYIKENTTANVEGLGWLPLVCLVVYVLGFSVGFGPIPWLLLGEILPSKIRGPAAALATAFNWTCAFLVTKSFPIMLENIKMYGSSGVFAIICTVGLLFVIFFVPETRGKSLEEIEKHLTGGSKRIRNVDSNKHNAQNGC